MLSRRRPRRKKLDRAALAKTIVVFESTVNAFEQVWLALEGVPAETVKTKKNPTIASENVQFMCLLARMK